MLEQAQARTTVIFSTRQGEFAEIITNAAGGGGGTNASGVVEGASGATGSRVCNLDDLDGIVVVGGDGTFFEVCINDCKKCFLVGSACSTMRELAIMETRILQSSSAHTSSAHVVRRLTLAAVQVGVAWLISPSPCPFPFPS